MSNFTMPIVEVVLFTEAEIITSSPIDNPGGWDNF